MITVGEVLEIANYNISEARMPLQIQLGREQLKNYTIAKRLGAKDDDDWEDWGDKVEEEKKKDN